jgi:hypothetical protein
MEVKSRTDRDEEAFHTAALKLWKQHQNNERMFPSSSLEWFSPGRYLPEPTHSTFEDLLARRTTRAPMIHVWLNITLLQQWK